MLSLTIRDRDGKVICHGVCVCLVCTFCTDKIHNAYQHHKCFKQEEQLTKFILREDIPDERTRIRKLCGQPAVHYHIIKSVRKQNRYDGTGHEKKNAYRNSVLYAVVFQYVTLLTALFP